MKEIALFILLIANIRASPFVLTDKFVQEFKDEMEALKKLSTNTQFQEGTLDSSKFNETNALKDAQEYDFIVVGGGTAGGVIASRLTEIPEWRVLLLEAGPPESSALKVPSLHPLLTHTPYNWGYHTEAQESWCLGMDEHKCAAPYGKSLGGTSSINSMQYTRGNHKDYDLWADQGNDGWCYSDVLPYFLKSQNAHLSHFDRKFHRQGGPVDVELPAYTSPLLDHFMHATKEQGLKQVDYNGKEQNGASVMQLTTKHGRRNSITETYLKPSSSRHNLVVVPLSHVIKIIINPHTKEAAGVKYLHDGHLLIAKASKEVILSAGGYNSPQLLLLSGVGSKDQLEHHKIPLVKELPVGEHLKDHVAYDVHFLVNGTDKNEETDDLIHWMKDGSGPLASTGVEGVAYVKTHASKDHSDYPDVQLTFSPKKHMKQLRIKKEVYEMLKPLEEKKSFTITVMPTHPLSNGNLKLKSHDPLNWPLISPNQFSDPDDHDINTMVEGIKKAVEIGLSAPFHQLGATLYATPIPGCEQHQFNTDTYWACAIRHLAYGMRHVVGGCKMGPAHDSTAVVDNKLKVYGIHKLRVADSSIIPISLTGDITIPTIMVGEKAADLIKNDWN